MLKVTRLNWLFVAGCSMALALAACGDKKKSSSTEKPTPEEVAAGACNKPSDSGQTCTGTDEYSECLQTMCASQYKTCLGEGYKSGNYAGGACETYFACVSTSADPCSCTQDSGCTDCFATIASCALSSSCTLPTCTSNGGAGTGNGGGAGTGVGSGKSCADLEACCPTLGDSQKQACESAVTQFKALGANGELACGASFGTYCPTGG